MTKQDNGDHNASTTYLGLEQTNKTDKRSQLILPKDIADCNIF